MFPIRVDFVSEAKAPLSNKILWATLSHAGGVVCRFLSSIVVARLLEPALMGRFAFCHWFVEFYIVFCTFGFNSAIPRYISELESRFPGSSAHGLFLGASVFHALLAVVSLPLLWIFGRQAFPSDCPKSVILSVMVLFVANLFGGLSQGILSGLQKFRLSSALVFLDGLILLAGQVSGAIYWGLPGALLGTAFGFALRVLVFLSLLVRVCSRGDGLAVSFPPGFWKYCRNTWLAALLSALVWGRTEIFILESLSSSAQAGYFSVGLLFSSLPLHLVSLISGPLLPHFTDLVGRKEVERLKREYRELTLIAALVSVPVSSILAGLMRVLVPLLLGHAYEPAWTSCALLALCGLWGFAAVGSPVVYAIGDSGLIAKWGIFAAVVLVGGNVILVPLLGAAGASGVRMAVQGILVFCGALILTRRYGLSFPVSGVTRVMVSGLLAGAVLGLVDCWKGWGMLQLIFLLPAGFLAFVAILRMTGGIPRRDLDGLSRLVGRLPAVLRPLAISSLSIISPA